MGVLMIFKNCYKIVTIFVKKITKRTDIFLCEIYIVIIIDFNILISLYNGYCRRVADDYLFDKRGNCFRVDEYDFEYDEEDDSPDYGKNCETWAIAVDRNETKVLIDDTWQRLE